MKERVQQQLKKNFYEHQLSDPKLFTATVIAEQLKLSRNSVSQYLNEALKEGKVIKINTRPVYFYPRKEVEEYYGKVSEDTIFASLEAFQKVYGKQKPIFEKLIGYDNSLRNVVEQSKAAICYPKNGLPIMIYGPTGTGKSMLANLLYEFALSQGLLTKEKRFVAVNCSEYANNPELLSANLFGHVKGAYTGADEDNEGLIAAANGGVLFLDEVHCLRAECQEKLFFFMDQGMYHKVGDNEHWYHSECRLLFATTENPQTTLLKTLLRRIPIMITLPPLKDRPLVEKRSLIYTLLNQESKRLQKSILLSNVVYQTLMDFEYTGNVGTMKNAIKAACANAFLNVDDASEGLEIHVYDLPDYILSSFPTLQLKASKDLNATMIPIEKLAGSAHTNTMLHLYHKLLTKYQEYQNTNMSFPDFAEQVNEVMQNYKDYLLYKSRYRKVANDNFMLKVLDKIYSIIMNKYSLNVPNNEIQIYATILSEYTKYVVDAKVWVSSNEDMVKKLVSTLVDHVPREYTVAQEIVENANLNLDLVLDDMMLSILTFAFVTYEQSHHSRSVGIILCHGYSTASSIAEAANRMLGEYVFDGIDMELNISIDKIVLQLDEYLKRKQVFEEVMLLVDMGSLEAIYKRIKPWANCDFGIMNNVTTKLALEVGLGLQQGLTIREILQQTKDNFHLSTHYIEGKNQSPAVLSVCATGLGAAKKISELLLQSLPEKVPVEIIPYEYQELVENGGKDTIFHRYQVSLIIGTIDPKVEHYPFIAVENLMMDEGIEELEKVFCDYLNPAQLKSFRKMIMKNFTLSNIVNHLTILNAQKVIEDVEEIVEYLESDLQVTLDASRKAGLYVHLSCLIERLMLRTETTFIDGLEDKVEQHQAFLAVARSAFSGAESRYSVEVPDAELLFIENYFKNL